MSKYILINRIKMSFFRNSLLAQMKNRSELLFFLIFIIFFSGPLPCTYCGTMISPDIDSIVTHCRLCLSAPRPNAFRNKFVCWQCSYSTYSTSNIKDHVRTHTGDKPFKCDLCDSHFTTAGGLRSHKKVHRL
jgi:hypothetical protein